MIAPLAVATNIAPIDGTLVAASVVGSGELHSYAFTGTLGLGMPRRTR